MSASTLPRPTISIGLTDAQLSAAHKQAQEARFAAETLYGKNDSYAGRLFDLEAALCDASGILSELEALAAE